MRRRVWVVGDAGRRVPEADDNASCYRKADIFASRRALSVAMVITL